MKFSILLFLAITFSGEGIAQCCSPGNPLGGYGNNGTLNGNSLKLFAQYKYSYSGKFKQGDQPYAGDTKDFRRSVKEADYNFIGIGGAWGISSRLTMEIETGYFLNKTQHHLERIIPEKQAGMGFTDLAFLIKPALYKKSEFEFTPALGLKIPLGKGDQKYQGAILPTDLQPTTGAVNYITGFFLYKGFLKQHFRIFVIGRYEFPRANPLGIQYGNTYLNSLFLSYSPSERFTFIVQARHEFRERDRSIYAGSFYSSGSQKIFIVPQITYSFTQSWDLSLFLDIPLYQYYNGYQLGNTFAAALMVSRKIMNLKKNETDLK